MLIETEYNKKTKKLLVSYLNKDGDIRLNYYDWAEPFRYEICSENDPDKDTQYRAYTNEPIKKVPTDNPDRYAIYEFLDNLPQKEQDVIYNLGNTKPYFVDIETFVGDNGFPEAADILDDNGNVIKEGAATPILVISIVYDDKIIVLGHKELPDGAEQRIIDATNIYFKKYETDYKFKYVCYADEFEMLSHFFYSMVPQMPIITGWNFLNYDWTYLVNRARKISKMVGDKEYKIDPRVASLTKHLHKTKGHTYELPAHRLIFDYMQLYNIFDETIRVKESSSLNFVSNRIIGNEKIKYDGKIQDMYDNDFEKYVYYNTVDSVLVQKIHESQNYMSIALQIAALAKIQCIDVISRNRDALGSLAITEGVLRCRFREQKNVVLFKDYNKPPQHHNVVGAWVKEPSIGMNRWTLVFDFSSLYPTTQREFMISPENYVGTQDKDNPERCTNGHIIDLEKETVTISGAVFKKEKSPTIKMLEDVFADRKKTKKKMFACKEKYKSILNQIKELENEI